MSRNQRKTIREAVVALLMDQTNAGSNVYSNRETPLWQSELPAILVYSGPESAEPRAANSRQSIRTLDLTIEIKAEANELLDDTLDILSGDVEELLSANRTFNGAASTSVYKSTDPKLSADGETIVGVWVLSFEVKYIA